MKPERPPLKFATGVRKSRWASPTSPGRAPSPLAGLRPDRERRLPPSAMTPPHADNRGFTLIEVLSVLVLLGVLAAVAFSRFAAGDTDHLLQKDLLIQHLRHAQLKAMADDTPWYVQFDATGPGYSYQLFRQGEAGPRTFPGEESDTVTLAAGVSLAMAAPALVAYDAWGRPATDAGAGTLQGVSRTITLSQGAATTTLTVTRNTGYLQ